MPIMLFSIALWIATCVAQDSVLKPPELLEAERMRARIQTASIEWCSVVETAESAHCEWYYTSRIAGADDLQINHGLADGRMHPQAEMGQPFSYTQNRLLLKDGEQWGYDEDTPGAQVAVDRTRFMHYRNLRDLGFEPTAAFSTVDTWYRTTPEKYEVERLSDRVLVTAHWSNGFDVQWTLDPNQGMQPVETSTLSNGSEVGGCTTTYQKVDDVWFPKTASFYHRGSLQATFTVLDAEFNRPDHPQELTPKDLGLIPGIQVSHQERENMAWTGEELIPLIDWLHLVQEGKADNSSWEALLEKGLSATGLGRYPRKLDDDFLGLTIAVARNPGLWEDYTRRFIQRFQLKPNQAEHAWKTLKECQKLAYGYLDEHEKDMKEARSDLASIDPKTTDADQLKRRAALEERLEKLHAPIDKIFNEKLKPGLAKLPTKEQIEAARQAEAARDKAIASAKPEEGK